MTEDRSYTEMYKRGYDNTAIYFAYIPDFKNQQDIIDYTEGCIAGREALKEIAK
jgi:hypothetical protein